MFERRRCGGEVGTRIGGIGVAGSNLVVWRRYNPSTNSDPALLSSPRARRPMANDDDPMEEARRRLAKAELDVRVALEAYQEADTEEDRHDALEQQAEAVRALDLAQTSIQALRIRLRDERRVRLGLARERLNLPPLAPASASPAKVSSSKAPAVVSAPTASSSSKADKKAKLVQPPRSPESPPPSKPSKTSSNSRPPAPPPAPASSSPPRALGGVSGRRVRPS